MKSFSKLINKNNIIKEDNTKFSNITPNGFCILKPGFVDEYADMFCDLLDKADWNVVNKKKMVLTPDQASTLYVNLEGEPFYNDLCDYMSSEPCLCVSCYKDINKCKDNDPICDMKEFKDSIRKEWGKDEMRNAMHSSDSEDNVIRETELCFKECNNDIKESTDNNIQDEPATFSAKDKLRIDNTINTDINRTCQFTLQSNTEHEPDYLNGVYQSKLVEKLQSSIAEEVEAGYLYLLTAQFIKGYERVNLQQKFEKYFYDEMLEHTKLLLKRLNEIGIEPGCMGCFPLIDQLCERNGHAWHFNGSMNSLDLIQTAIQFEQNAIETYKDLEYFSRGIDIPTNQLAKHLLQDEIEHLTELREFQESAAQMTWDNL